MPTDPIHRLQAAAKCAAEHVAPGHTARRVVVMDAHDHPILSTMIPPTVVRTPDNPPAVKAGWDERGGRVYYDGRPVTVVGRKLDVLRVLVAHERVDNEKLREAWQGVMVEESSMRWQIAELRKALKAAFPEFPDDPITLDDGCYVLRI